MAGMSRRRFLVRAGAGAVGGVFVPTVAIAATAGEQEAVGALVSIVAGSRELDGRVDATALTAQVLDRYYNEARGLRSARDVAAALDELTFPERFARVSRSRQLSALRTALTAKPPSREVASALAVAAASATGCDRAPTPLLTLTEGLCI